MLYLTDKILMNEVWELLQTKLFFTEYQARVLLFPNNKCSSLGTYRILYVYVCMCTSTNKHFHKLNVKNNC